MVKNKNIVATEINKQTMDSKKQQKKSVQDYSYKEQISILENEIKTLNNRILYLQGRLDLLKEQTSNKNK